MTKVASIVAGFSVFFLGVASTLSQQRAPATPLITHDPYFSIWSATDNPADSETTHWTGSAQPIAGIARIDGKSFRFMGHNPSRSLQWSNRALQSCLRILVMSFAKAA